MELNIDPEAINKMVSDAVLKSAIGEAIKKAVDTSLVKFSQSWDNPLESVVRNHVAELAREVLRDEHGEALRERMRAALATKLSDEFIDRVCEAVASKYDR